MLEKQLTDWTSDDILRLVQNAVPEGISLDYKASLPGGTDEERKEFLADASSFANTLGGLMVFGIEDERDSNGRATGIPKGVIGVSATNIDAEIGRLQAMARDGVEPPISNIVFKAIEVPGKGRVLVARVSQSLNAPHMVAFKRSSRFFKRTSTGKYQLSRTEIMNAFQQGTDFLTKLASYRQTRVGLLANGDSAIPLPEGPRVILHLLPLSPEARVDVLELFNNMAKNDSINPIITTWRQERINFAGYLSYADKRGYVQVYRNGRIEAVSANLVSASTGEEKWVPSLSFEDAILGAVRRYAETLVRLGVEFPIAVGLTLVGAKGYVFANRGYAELPQPLDSNLYLCDDVFLESLDNIDVALKPVFDSLWQAGGYPGSIYYKDGRWVGK